MGARRLTSVFVAFVFLLATAMLPVASAILAQAPEGESPEAQTESVVVVSGDAAYAVDASLETQADLGQGFYYQGTLTESGAPVTASRAMVFTLWGVASGGTPLGTVSTTVAVNRGQFSVVLTYPGQFTGAARWLGVTAKDSGGTPRDLGRRQILAVPYATSLMPGATVTGTGVPDTLTIRASGAGYPLRAIATGAVRDGVWGTGTNQGVYGNTTGTGTWDSGIFGRADGGEAKGGIFYSYSNDGVYAYTGTITGTAVSGYQSPYSPADENIFWTPGGQFGGQNGVVGFTQANGGWGVAGWNKGTTGGGAGIFGRNDSASGWAGRFTATDGNGVSITVPLSTDIGITTNGTKNAVVATDEGARLLYTEESTEVWFADYGFGALVDGTETVTIDPLFAQTVDLSEPYHVFLQAYGSADLYVTDRTATGFTVRLREGDGACEFSYRLVAVRQGFAGQRLAAAPWADSDPYLFPAAAGALGTEGVQTVNGVPVAGVVAP